MHQERIPLVEIIETERNEGAPPFRPRKGGSFCCGENQTETLHRPRGSALHHLQLLSATAVARHGSGQKSVRKNPGRSAGQTSANCGGKRQHPHPQKPRGCGTQSHSNCQSAGHPPLFNLIPNLKICFCFRRFFELETAQNKSLSVEVSRNRQPGRCGMKKCAKGGVCVHNSAWLGREKRILIYNRSVIRASRLPHSRKTNLRPCFS
jgi:hypothetical protein